MDDEESDRLLMQMAFKKEGFDTALRTVSDGKLAIDYLSGSAPYADRQQHPLPGVVLLDLNLPEVHGFEVLNWIRTQPLHRDLPVVVFSSSERQEDSSRAQQLGATEFLQKPNSPGEFRELARRLKQGWPLPPSPIR